MKSICLTLLIVSVTGRHDEDGENIVVETTSGPITGHPLTSVDKRLNYSQINTVPEYLQHFITYRIVSCSGQHIFSLMH